MNDFIDNEKLISLVEARPPLWDKTLEIFKDRNATRIAWREVFLELRSDFDQLKEKEKNDYGYYKQMFYVKKSGRENGTIMP
ncbi:hypothetical protein TNIN_263471 [Trichonephila inaurata madagascariensis]|uniref:MADF domain-containing protein n=1 Tax=Trichonephila inaurata madagascariensis TaxID=2747483 RepID=A0A8X6YW10_9ARAC|nr:hypothetical protein TNIN_263471 [Trichonephila inaurata madagascariensis]